MSVGAIDHLSLPTSHPDALIDFYRAIGLEVIGEREWRAGEQRWFAFAFGDHRINVHPPAIWRDDPAAMCGRTAVPGCGDVCLRWDGTVAELLANLDRHGLAVVEGPVSREGGRDRGRAIGTSVYLRDPDGSLVELIVYDDAGAPAGTGG